MRPFRRSLFSLLAERTARLRVTALSMAFYRRTAALTTLLAALVGASACDGFKKVPDACSVSIAPRELTVPVNAQSAVVGTAFDCDGASIAKKTVKFSS